MQPPAPYGHPPAYPPPPPSPAPHPRTGVAVALVSCFVMPIVYVVLVFELLGHRFDGGGSMAPLGVSIAFGFVLWITGLVLSIRSIVVSGRIGASRAVGPDAWPEARSGDGPERPAETLRRVALESLVDGALMASRSYSEHQNVFRPLRATGAAPAVLVHGPP